MVKNLPANAGALALAPGSGRSPGKRNGRPLQYSCLENPMGRGAWGGYSLWSHKRVGHNLVTKQKQKIAIPCYCYGKRNLLIN